MESKASWRRAAGVSSAQSVIDAEDSFRMVLGLGHLSVQQINAELGHLCI
jgi:hypothetical protein